MLKNMPCRFRFLSLGAIIAASLIFAGGIASGVDGYKNSPTPDQTNLGEAPRLAPGLNIRLPDGAQTAIAEVLPDGNFRTPEGFVISPEGVLQNGPDQGATITVTPNISGAENSININIPSPVAPVSPAIPQPGEGEESPKQELSEGATLIAPGEARPKTPDLATVPEKDASDAEDAEPGIVALLPGMTAPATAPEKEAPTATNPKDKPGVAPKGKSDEKTKDLTLAQMLPLTREGKPTPNTTKPKEKAEKPIPKKQTADPKAAKEPAESPNARKPESGKKPENKPKAEKQTKPKAGEPMRIPETALKSGNLSFLEGCWEGTRPEYTTKRTIKECFCFGKDGKSGKRRIYDRQYGRTCIGPSRANLAKSGVLSVTSSSMPCSDGERWGGAEMQCRNSGPRTPCSWIFTDANNGRQAYEIPFLRVNSCGGR